MNYSKSFFLLIFSLFILFSCSESEEDVLNTEELKLVGSWQLTEFEYGGENSTSYQGQTATVTYVGEGYDMDLTLEFKNNRELATEGNYSIELETETEGYTSTEYWTDQEFLGEGTWRLDENKLTLDRQGQVQEAIVESLDENTLRISYSSEQVSSQAGATVTIQVDAFYVFEKM